MIKPEVFLDEDTSRDRRVMAETYLGQFRRPGVRITLRSGPRGSFTTIMLTQEEFEMVIGAFLRHKATHEL